MQIILIRDFTNNKPYIMIKIYHNPRCKKSRAGLEYLKQKISSFEIVKYLTAQPFTFQSLSDLIDKMDISAEDLIRTQESVYKQYYKGKDLSKDEWIQAMVENPKLIGRPVVESEEAAVLGNPPENIDKLF